MQCVQRWRHSFTEYITLSDKLDELINKKVHCIEQVLKHLKPVLLP